MKATAAPSGRNGTSYASVSDLERDSSEASDGTQKKSNVSHTSSQYFGAALGPRYWRPSYEVVAWLLYSTITLAAIVDRFTTNIWPRQTFLIGKGTAGTDFVDGLKPGPWSVAFYDIAARVSGESTPFDNDLSAIPRVHMCLDNS
jgi:hypothetical protein